MIVLLDNFKSIDKFNLKQIIKNSRLIKLFNTLCSSIYIYTLIKIIQVNFAYKNKIKNYVLIKTIEITSKVKHFTG